MYSFNLTWVLKNHYSLLGLFFPLSSCWLLLELVTKSNDYQVTYRTLQVINSMVGSYMYYFT